MLLPSVGLELRMKVARLASEKKCLDSDEYQARYRAHSGQCSKQSGHYIGPFDVVGRRHGRRVLSYVRRAVRLEA